MFKLTVAVLLMVMRYNKDLKGGIFILQQPINKYAFQSRLKAQKLLIIIMLIKQIS